MSSKNVHYRKYIKSCVADTNLHSKLVAADKRRKVSFRVGGETKVLRGKGSDCNILEVV